MAEIDQPINGHRHDFPHLSVLGLLVATEIHLPLEGSAAEVAGEGFVAGVLARVGDEVTALGERLPAHDTLVRLLTCSRKPV